MGEKVTFSSNGGTAHGYLAVPDAARAHAGVGLLYLPDMFSIWPNSKLIADRLAANGYLTLIVDLLNGDALPRDGFEAAGFDFPRYLAHGSTGDNPHTPAAVDPIVRAGIRFLREEMGVKKLGAHGYCFGAKVRVVGLLSSLSFSFVFFVLADGGRTHPVNMKDVAP